MIWQTKWAFRAIVTMFLIGLFSTAAVAKSGSCTSQNPAVNVILAPGSNGQNLIYGDSDFGSTGATYNNPNDPQFNGGTIYNTGVFNVCSGSEDMTLNLGHTSRYINISFFQLLAGPAPGATDLTNNTYAMDFVNVRDAYALQTIGGSINTCLFANFGSNTTSYTLRFENPSVYGSVCPDGAGATAVNSGGDTAVVTVTHPDVCTWIVQPVADSTGIFRGGVAETVNKSTVSGGQYNLPFAMKLVLVSPSCPLN